jgi:hypothetical protein
MIIWTIKPGLLSWCHPLKNTHGFAPPWIMGAMSLFGSIPVDLFCLDYWGILKKNGLMAVTLVLLWASQQRQRQSTKRYT